ncbi:MAG: hypothetical protein HOY79_33810 [Streptomyces sp.]|nr:hypothetical protein [Streptomyces sp.]NUS11331.1 hypothetical protein [Streptomyces sp.]NUS23394.1 hypothetical protein [Streptomyces sp.]
MTYYKAPAFPRPIGPLCAIDPRTGRIAQLGDRIEHFSLGKGGEVAGVAWDDLCRHAVPVILLDGRTIARPYAWSVVTLTG